MPIKTLIMVERNVLRLEIDIDRLDGGKFTAHILDERCARGTVDAGNRNGGDHRCKERVSVADEG